MTGYSIVQPSRLVGANRHYVESKLPHLGRLLEHGRLLVVGPRILEVH